MLLALLRHMLYLLPVESSARTPMASHGKLIYSRCRDDSRPADALLDWSDERFKQWASTPRMASRTVSASLPSPHPLAQVLLLKTPLSSMYAL